MGRWIRRVLTHLILGGVLFVVGVLVGRGQAPITFDTRPFQSRLTQLMGDAPLEAPAGRQRAKLTFYSALKQEQPPDERLMTGDEPVDADRTVDPDTISDRDAAAVSRSPDDTMPEADTDTSVTGRRQIKTALKYETDIRRRHASGDGVAAPSADRSAAATALVSTESGISPALDEQPSRPNYTIQVASFRQLADAIALMERLKVNRIQPHRVLAHVNGRLWYRVRVGSFVREAAARKTLARIEDLGLPGIIIQKEIHHDGNP